LLTLRILFVALLSSGLLAAKAEAGALKTYVEEPDASYGWTVRSKGKVLGTPYVELILTSQTWKTGDWKHLLTIIKPLTTAANVDHALLLIDGGSWRPEFEDPNSPTEFPDYTAELVSIANALGTPVAVLKQVPNQPLFDDLIEDRLIAHTFEQFMQTGDVTWPALFPMVKSAVRGMDAIQAYTAKAWNIELETFTVTGASKRGWTAWLTAAVDERVTAIAPIVIDILNMEEQIAHQVEVWGETSPEIAPYTELGLFEQFDTRRGQRLLKLIDPYSYRRLLGVPKLIVVGTNDAFWPVDAVNLYRRGLPGQTELLYVPGAGHGVPDPLNIARIGAGLNALHAAALGRIDLAHLDWRYRLDGDQIELEVEASRRAVTATLFVSRSPTRDFREATWEEVGIDQLPWEAGFQLPFQNELEFHVDVPRQGYVALFAELVFEDVNLVPYALATPIQVIGPGGVLLEPLANLTPY
jgi:PhoPQ-activated pathogenicity-related protein